MCYVAKEFLFEVFRSNDLFILAFVYDTDSEENEFVQVLTLCFDHLLDYPRLPARLSDTFFAKLYLQFNLFELLLDYLAQLAVYAEDA